MTLYGSFDWFAWKIIEILEHRKLLQKSHDREEMVF